MIEVIIGAEISDETDVPESEFEETRVFSVARMTVHGNLPKTEKMNEHEAIEISKHLLGFPEVMMVSLELLTTIWPSTHAMIAGPDNNGWQRSGCRRSRPQRIGHNDDARIR